MGMITLEQVKDKSWEDHTSDERKFLRGLWGEYEVNKALNQEFKAMRFSDELAGKHTSFLFDRIHIPVGEGKTTEIDTIFVSQKGIFALEVKSWSPELIWGEQGADNWVGVRTRKDGSLDSYPIPNPYSQHQHHLKHLKRIVGSEAERYTFGYIVLVNADKDGLKDSNWQGKEPEVFGGIDELIEWINKLPNVLSEMSVRGISLRLSVNPHGFEFKSLADTSS